MNDFKSKIEKHVAYHSNWREKVQYRRDNPWLDYSFEIALSVVIAIQQTKGMTQAKLAEMINVSPQQISKIVKGTENLTLETIHKLSQALKCELITFPDYSTKISRPKKAPAKKTTKKAQRRISGRAINK